MNHAKRFVALEGIDNAGKTSLLDEIYSEFSPVMQVHITRELTSPIGHFLKTALPMRQLTSLDKVLLFAADRQLRLSTGLAALLAEPGLCVADRWTMSAAAYRSAEDTSLASYVESVNAVFPKPGLTILIDLPAELSLKRGVPINKNNYDAEYLSKVRERYLVLASSVGALVLDGTVPLRLLSRNVLTAIRGYAEIGP